MDGMHPSGLLARTLLSNACIFPPKTRPTHLENQVGGGLWGEWGRDHPKAKAQKGNGQTPNRQTDSRKGAGAGKKQLGEGGKVELTHGEPPPYTSALHIHLADFHRCLQGTHTHTHTRQVKPTGKRPSKNKTKGNEAATHLQDRGLHLQSLRKDLLATEAATLHTLTHLVDLRLHGGNLHPPPAPE
jgi:hypothetical protein